MKRLKVSLLVVIIILFFLPTSHSQIEYTTSDIILTGMSGGGVIDNVAISPIDENLLMLTSNMTGVYLAVNGPKDWKMIHHSQLLYVSNGRACFHPKDKDIIFAPSGTRLKVSRDRGKTWQNIGNIGRIEFGLLIHPESTDFMLAGSGNAVWRSTNAGVNWSQLSGPSGSVLGFHFDRTSPDEGGTCFGAAANGVWRSDDGGATWTKKANGLPTGNLVSFCGASNKESNKIILYCAVGNTVYRSTDKGENWSSLSASITGNVPYLAASDVNPDIVWASMGGQNIRKSSNAGSSWSQMYYHKTNDSNFNTEHNYFTSWMGQNAGTYSLKGAGIAPGNPDFFMFTTEMLCIYTEDGGRTWKNAHSNPVIKAGEPVPKSFLNTGLNVTTTYYYYVDPFEHNRQYLAYTDIGFARSVDNGESWLFWPYWGPDKTVPFEWHNTIYEIAFDPEIPGKMWGAFSRAHDIPNGNAIIRDHVTKLSDADKKGGIGFSNDFAATWQYLNHNTGLPGRPTISVIVDPSSPTNSRTLYAAVYEEGVYKSTDDGRNWTKKSTGLGSAINMHVTRLQLHKDGTLFCLVTGKREFPADGVGLYKSVNGGDSWEKVNKNKDFLWPRDFALHPDNSNEIYIGSHNAGSQQGGLWKTTDGGKNWTALAQKGAHFGAYLHPRKPGWIYMTLCEGSDPSSGLWLSKDNGVTWIPYTKIPHRWIQRVTFHPVNDDVIYVSTFGASALKLPADPEGVLSSKAVSVQPSFYVYPNPCREELFIRSENSFRPLEYRIYDVKGSTLDTGQFVSEVERVPLPHGEGVYFMSLKSPDRMDYVKFIKR